MPVTYAQRLTPSVGKSPTHTLKLPAVQHPQALHGLLFPLYHTIISLGSNTSTEFCPLAFLTISCLPACARSSRTDGSRCSTTRHAAARGLGWFCLCPSSGSVRSWAARCHSRQDGSKSCTNEAQQPTSTDASVPNDGQW